MLVVGIDLVERYFHDRRGDKGIKAARAQYDAWFGGIRWRTPEDVKAAHPKASILTSGRVVFDIKGNSYRLITIVNYEAGIVAIRFFGSHADYDKVDAETV